MASFFNRIIRAAQLDENLYEEVEADKGALGQAMGVVVLSSIAAGIGSYGDSPIRIAIGTVAALITWFIWSGLIYLIGAKLLPEPQTEADYGQLLRTVGFSSAPGMLRILGLLPFVGGGVVFLGASLWMMAAMVVAAKQALDYRSRLRAVGVCAIGWIIQMSVLVGLIVYLERNGGIE
ncbi:MAG TPA: YIP1 family protein [Candidatus Manganitrophaceae bacterium]|nr:YIP1 family protein [Candidatus Manganitrophaceae bacterium]